MAGKGRVYVAYVDDKRKAHLSVAGLVMAVLIESEQDMRVREIVEAIYPNIKAELRPYAAVWAALNALCASLAAFRHGRGMYRVTTLGRRRFTPVIDAWSVGGFDRATRC